MSFWHTYLRVFLLDINLRVEMLDSKLCSCFSEKIVRSAVQCKGKTSTRRGEYLPSLGGC